MDASPVNIQVKDKDVLISVLLYDYHYKLLWVVEALFQNTSLLVITCGAREGDSGVHGTVPCRGLDIRSWHYPNPEKLVEFINDRFSYDAKRPSKQVAKLHDSGSGKHIHLQVHPNTRRRS